MGLSWDLSPKYWDSALACYCPQCVLLLPNLLGIIWDFFLLINNFLLLQVNRYAFSGGQDSIENHRKYGANLEVLLTIFLAVEIKTINLGCVACGNSGDNSCKETIRTIVFRKPCSTWEILQVVSLISLSFNLWYPPPGFMYMYHGSP